MALTQSQTREGRVRPEDVGTAPNHKQVDIGSSLFVSSIKPLLPLESQMLSFYIKYGKLETKEGKHFA